MPPRPRASRLAPGEFVVTAEYKVNLLRGARGERLHCRAEVVKPRTPPPEPTTVSVG